MMQSGIQRVLVVGAGMMGQQIAAYCMLNKIDVILFDVDPLALSKASAVKAVTGSLFGNQSTDRIRRVITDLRIESDPRAARDADLLIEAVPEKLKLKRDVFAQFAGICPPHAIFTTNTSVFLPSAMADSTGRAAQFAALHFALEGEIAEIMPHAGTSPETIRRLQAFVRQIGHIPITCAKETSGYVLNTLIMALNGAALQLAAEGVASFEDIDRAWMKTMGTNVGPFGILDGVGLDTAWSITEFRAKAARDAQLQKIADFLKRYVDQGWLGVKSGQGFYRYPIPAYKQPGFLGGNLGSQPGAIRTDAHLSVDPG